MRENRLLRWLLAFTLPWVALIFVMSVSRKSRGDEDCAGGQFFCGKGDVTVGTGSVTVTATITINPTVTIPTATATVTATATTNV